MISIYKYSFPISFGEHTISIPAGSNIIDAQVQDGKFVIWAEIPEVTTADMPVIDILILPTGMKVIPKGSNQTHFKTIQVLGLVFHIYLKY